MESPPARRKSKGKAPSESPDPTARRRKSRRSVGSEDEVEQAAEDFGGDFGGDFDNGDNDHEEAEEEAEEEEVEAPKPKKAAAKKPKSAPAAKAKFGYKRPTINSDDDDEGRRSKRSRTEPLKYWQLERQKLEKVDGGFLFFFCSFSVDVLTPASRRTEMGPAPRRFQLPRSLQATQDTQEAASDDQRRAREQGQNHGQG
jgi:hypothetical protein